MASFVAVRAAPSDAETVAVLLAAAGARLAEQGFANWVPPYDVSRVRVDAIERDVWLVYDGDAPVATYTLSHAPVRPYDPAPWPDAALPSAYLNRLAVDPPRQGAGLGAWCLTEIDGRALAMGARAVRCDVLRDNTALCRFYERRGYRAYGERTHSGWTFACYERVLR